MLHKVQDIWWLGSCAVVSSFLILAPNYLLKTAIAFFPSLYTRKPPAVFLPVISTLEKRCEGVAPS
ncbi:MAG: hypothetical protein LDL41_03900 [Coleofasciculus sp. S288]|nr:hypothetical protein [Coleofasciculus sp. S288]